MRLSALPDTCSPSSWSTGLSLVGAGDACLARRRAAEGGALLAENDDQNQAGDGSCSLGLALRALWLPINKW